MRIAVIGSGAREHALTWSLSDKGRNEVWALPGNAGCVRSAPIAIDDFNGIENFCRLHAIELVVVGQEQALALGIQNFLTQKGFCVFGPSREASRLEASKIWAKHFMHKYSVHTAPFAIAKTVHEAELAISQMHGDCVIKWDGLAAGKGVSVCHNAQEAQTAFSELLGRFSSTEFVIEKRLEGHELSVFAITNGEQYTLLPAAKDYKRAYDGDLGPNTGGMGAVSCDSLLDETLRLKIEKRIIKPTLAGLKKEQIPYIGFLYFGLMISEGEPFLLEYNVRLGDPESSAVLPRLQSSLAELITACLEHSLDKVELKIDPRPCVNVVLAAKGYPRIFETGLPIPHCEQLAKDLLLFQASTYQEGSRLLTNGGRILNCAALGQTLETAATAVYSTLAHLDFKDFFYRNDIGRELFA